MRLRLGVLMMAMMSGMVVSLMPGRGRAQDDLPRQRIVYAVPGMEAVRVQRDFIYKRDNGTELKMDIYLPPVQSNNTLLPSVLFLHGGGRPSATISAKDWSVFVSYGQLLAASGVVAVTFNYRFSSLDKVQTAAQDIQDALRYVP